MPQARLSIPQNLTAAPGESIRVPVEISSLVPLSAPNRLIGSDLIILFDSSVLTATGVTAGDFISSRPEWAFVDSIENSLGAISVVAFSSTPLAGNYSGTLVNLNFTVNAAATSTTTAINLAESAVGKFTDLVDESDAFLMLEGPITNDADDPVDGLLTVIADTSVWQNPTNRLDVDNNGTVAPLDVLSAVNEINLQRVVDANGRLPAERPADQDFFDVNGDGFLSPTDVLAVINFLNTGSGGEGEGDRAGGAEAGAGADVAADGHVWVEKRDHGRLEMWLGDQVEPAASDAVLSDAVLSDAVLSDDDFADWARSEAQVLE